jgi:hypothetical protein
MDFVEVLKAIFVRPNREYEDHDGYHQNSLCGDKSWGETLARPGYGLTGASIIQHMRATI